MLSVLDGVARWMLGLLAILALIAALFAGLLYLIGRGLKASATWARVLAGLVSAVALLKGAGALAYLPRGSAIADGVAMAGFVYVLWVLVWKFADPATGTSRNPDGAVG
jgi:hypothetical protein